jgi:hypothetical protein
VGKETSEPSSQLVGADVASYKHDDLAKQVDSLSKSDSMSTRWLPGSATAGDLAPLQIMLADDACAAAATTSASLSATPNETSSIKMTAEFLCRQLVNASSNLVAAAGLPTAAVESAVLNAQDVPSSSTSCSRHGPSKEDIAGVSDLGLAAHASVLIQAGHSATEVQQLLMPGLLLLLAGMAADPQHKGSTYSCCPEGDMEESAMAYQAAGGSTAAASTEGSMQMAIRQALQAFTASLCNDGKAGGSPDSHVSSKHNTSSRRSSNSRDSSMLSFCIRGGVLLLWSFLLLTLGFVVAVRLSPASDDAESSSVAPEAEQLARLLLHYSGVSKPHRQLVHSLAADWLMNAPNNGF